MKTPMQELKEFLWNKKESVNKRELLVKIDRLIKDEKNCIMDAVNHGRNKYINEQLTNESASDKRTFAEFYYQDLYDTN